MFAACFWECSVFLAKRCVSSIAAKNQCFVMMSEINAARFSRCAQATLEEIVSISSGN